MIYQVDNLKFSYDNRALVLNNVDLGLDEGQLLCVLGRNGSGKSTFFGCLLGLLKPMEGTIILDGRKLSEMKERDIAGIVSFVPQNNNPAFGFTAFEYVLMGCAARLSLFSRPGKEEEKMAEEALELLGISEFKDRVVTELSGGERQQLAIARAVASKPKAILFDEPTAHLDYSNQIKVLKMIKALSKKGYAIAVTTHDPNHAIVLEGRVALFDGKGGVKTGTADELITEENLCRIYGSDLKIRYMEEFRRNVCVYPSLDE